MLSRIIGLLRDITKASWRLLIQLRTRLFYVEREAQTSVSVSAVLDVIPQGSWHKRNLLLMRKRAYIESQSVVNTWHGNVILDESCSIGIGSIVIGPVTFHAHSGCGQHCFISGISHEYTDLSRHFSKQGFNIKEVVIEENVWIGSNCVVLLGVRIGKNSVLGAGSVVTKDIPAYSVAIGNPARIIKQYDSERREWIRV